VNAYSTYLRVIGAAAVVIVAAIFLAGLRPAVTGADAPARLFEVQPGDGFFAVAQRLADTKLIRSKISFEIFAFATGAADKLQVGTYQLAPTMSAPTIVRALANGIGRETTVRIPDGASVYQVDALLADAGVIDPGSLIAFAATDPSVEGRLTPDTYQFFMGASIAELVDKFEGNFNTKIMPILDRDATHAKEDLILASLVEKEVPGERDRRIVAGILKKRLAAGMPLQIDATVCYAKQIKAQALVACYPLSPFDFAINSPYNTYLHGGLPKGPIGSPGAGAVEAVLASLPSPYWYYLSDPATNRTIFSATLDEHTANRVKYLER
jgi:UPF0755 protein